MPRLRLTCREVTRLVLARDELPPGRWDRLALRLHWAICAQCNRFRRQADVMRDGLDRWRAYRDAPGDEG